MGARGLGCDLREREELGGKDADVCTTEHGCGASRSAREREPDRIGGAGSVLGSKRERWGVCTERGASSEGRQLF